MYKEAPSRVFLNLSSTSEPFPATIHGFNPMKHERVSEKGVMGGEKANIHGFSPMKHERVSEKGVMGGEKANEEELAEKYKDEIDSWLSLNPESDDEQNNNRTSWGEVDKDLDIKEYNPCFENQYQVHYNPQQCYNIRWGCTGSESLVPLSFAGATEQHQEQWQNFSSGMENEMSKAQFVHHPLRSQSVSVPFMDVGIVPDATMSSISADSYRRNPEWPFGIHSSTTRPMQPNLVPMNREAKVQRYREKRKARKFEKKIRYASRQAYAETRPRVKGKFAREIDKESELDQMFSIDEYPHGIGPSS